MAENKVTFGLKNVYYSVLTEETTTTGTTYTYANPVAVPGAVNLSLEQQGEVNKFWADNVAYYVSSSNSGYEGDLEMAAFPDAMLKALWGLTEDSTDHVLIESSSATAKRFALLFQIDGDQNDDYYVFYNCTGTRPSIASGTKSDSTEPNTQTSTITASALGDGSVMAKTMSTTTTSVKTGWFSTVWRQSSSD